MRYRSMRTAGVLALILMALPSAAYANAGTPLMWAAFLHLTAGNLFIGLAEGYALARILRRPWRACMIIMVGGNSTRLSTGP